MIKELISNIHWLGHDSFRIEGEGLTIYIDPYQLKTGLKADIILITHEHHDHCSPDDVVKVQKDDTVIIANALAAKRLKGHVNIIQPGESMNVKGIPIEAVPAYNVNKFRSPGVTFHPRKSNHVGFILTVEGKRIYHSGDTDFTPEMKSIQADVALLPVSGIYVMTAEEAAEAATAIAPQVVIPMHIGRDIGSLDDAQRFKEVTSLPVEILPMEG